MNMSGLFITFEGLDKAGKTTQIARLAARLEQRGYTVTSTREPGGTPLCEEIRQLLMKKQSEKLVDEAELLLFSASRAQLLRERIWPELAAGHVVLCDRFADSTTAYQGYARGMDLEFIHKLNDYTLGGRWDTTPLSWKDRTLLADIPALKDAGVDCVVLGNRERLSPTLRAAIAALEKRTEKNGAMTLIVFLSYSGKWDIFQAARRMAEDLAKDPSKDLDVNDFDRYLITAGYPDPDLIIRTSGEQRISNYLLWQGAYSEFLFVEQLWPDFREESFRRALAEYAKRDRRYGKVK